MPDLHRIKLDSWKEISAFLGRDVRTCQRWEKELGLPIHRFDNSVRPRVFAYRDEIERWMREQSSMLGLTGASPRRRISPILLIAGAAAVLTAVFLISLLRRPSRPADFRIYGSKLVILDENRRQIREIETGFTMLENNQMYKQHFQQKRIIEREFCLPHIMIRDITGDGAPEILFKVQTKDLRHSDLLICYSASGREMWRRRIGRRTVYGGDVIENDYLICGFDVIRLSRGGPLHILLIANHKTRFPGLLTLLDADGNTLAEFWNTGRINDYALLDVNDDGRLDILAAGYNEEHRCPCCAALDGDRPGGRSPALDEPYLMGEGLPCCVLAYILLPTAAAGDVLDKNSPIEWISIASGEPEREIRLENIITYTLNYRLELTDIKLLERFLLDLAKFRRKGLCDMDPDRLIKALMTEGARYYDGKGFVSSPTLNPGPALSRN